MAERKAQQKYYPIDWDPSKGMLNKFHGTHHLRERAKKLDQGIMVIRFEMPWNIWCNGCNKVIIKGRRFNAEKKTVGNYHSTKIWDFKMKCFMCSHEIHMQTDPEHRDYKVASGGRRKIEEWTPELQMSEPLMDDDKRTEMRSDPFKKLEHLTKDKEVILGKVDQFADLLELQEKNSKDDYLINRKLREQFRNEKKALKDLDEERISKGLTIPLLPASSEDEIAASKVQLKTQTVTHEQFRKQQHQKVATSSIFGNQYKAPAASSSSSSSSMTASGREKLLQKAMKQGILTKPTAKLVSPNNPGFSMTKPASPNLKH